MCAARKLVSAPVDKKRIDADKKIVKTKPQAIPSEIINLVPLPSESIYSNETFEELPTGFNYQRPRTILEHMREWLNTAGLVVFTILCEFEEKKKEKSSDQNRYKQNLASLKTQIRRDTEKLNYLNKSGNGDENGDVKELKLKLLQYEIAQINLEKQIVTADKDFENLRNEIEKQRIQFAENAVWPAMDLNGYADLNEEVKLQKKLGGKEDENEKFNESVIERMVNREVTEKWSLISESAKNPDIKGISWKNRDIVKDNLDDGEKVNKEKDKQTEITNAFTTQNKYVITSQTARVVQIQEYLDYKEQKRKEKEELEKMTLEDKIGVNKPQDSQNQIPKQDVKKLGQKAPEKPKKNANANIIVEEYIPDAIIYLQPPLRNPIRVLSDNQAEQRLKQRKQGTQQKVKAEKMEYRKQLDFAKEKLEKKKESDIITHMLQAASAPNTTKQSMQVSQTASRASSHLQGGLDASVPNQEALTEAQRAMEAMERVRKMKVDMEERRRKKALEDKKQMEELTAKLESQQAERMQKIREREQRTKNEQIAEMNKRKEERQQRIQQIEELQKKEAQDRKQKGQPLYLKIEQKYQQDVLAAEELERQRKIAEIKEGKKPIDPEEIKQFAQNYDQELAAKQEIFQNQFKMHVNDVSKFYRGKAAQNAAEEAQALKLEQQKKKEEEQRKRQRIQEYKQLVDKDHKPTIDEKKQKELEQRVQKLETRPEHRLKLQRKAVFHDDLKPKNKIVKKEEDKENVDEENVEESKEEDDDDDL